MDSADKEFEEGKKILKSKYFWKKMLGYNQYEDAMEKLEHAAKIYKMNRNFKKASQAYKLVAGCQNKLERPDEEIEAYIEVYNCLKHSNVKDSIECLKKIIELNVAQCDIRQLAKWYRHLGDVYDGEGELELAVNAYKSYFEYDESPSIEYQVKAAKYLAQLEQYEDAVQAYEKILAHHVQNRLLQYSVPSLSLTLILIRLVQDDAISAQRHYDDFSTYYSGRSHSLILDFITAYKENNIEALVDAVREYDKISRINVLDVNLLSRIKKNMEMINGEESLL